jgi:2-C-methyl-D-erythritol 4-phosphate cytidylyltransferase
MVEWSIAAFRAAESVAAIVVAVPPSWAGRLEAAEAVPGGSTRAQSVANALQAVDTDLVAVHDGARPLVTPELIEGTIGALLADPGADAAIAATPVTDPNKQVPPPAGSGKLVKDSDAYRVINPSAVVETTLDRGRLWAAQTPQAFRTGALRRALDAWREDGGDDPRAAAEATDEAMLVEAAGGRVLIHPSPPENLKVTTPLDLELAALLLDRA